MPTENQYQFEKGDKIKLIDYNKYQWRDWQEHNEQTGIIKGYAGVSSGLSHNIDFAENQYEVLWNDHRISIVPESNIRMADKTEIEKLKEKLTK